MQTDSYTFNDVLIRPKFSEISSRKTIDLSTDFGPFQLRLPIIGAPMKSVTGPDMAYELNDWGALGILHRFNQDLDDIRELHETFYSRDRAHHPYTYGVALGVHPVDQMKFETLYEQFGVRIFCIDIAHGHCSQMRDMLTYCKDSKPDAYIIAGNVATASGARDLAMWGADAIRCGIGGGRACETRKRCGVGVPQLYAMQEIYRELKYMPSRPTIISDGGIQNIGDIAKALKFSDAVMVGSLISGTTETPGKVFKDETGQYYKMYMGSASGENKVDAGLATEYIEGIATKVPFKGKVEYILREIRDGLQSALSYTGSCNLNAFRENCEFGFLSESGRAESKF